MYFPIVISTSSDVYDVDVIHRLKKHLPRGNATTAAG
jgi:hypothetical protein